jgi:hypothetical protein
MNKIECPKIKIKDETKYNKKNKSDELHEVFFLHT